MYENCCSLTRLCKNTLHCLIVTGYTDSKTYLIPQSHQAHSHDDVLQNGLRTGCCQKIVNRFKVLDVLARSGSLYYVHVVRTQFEPVLNNVVRKSLI